jgi:hypothetical protein
MTDFRNRRERYAEGNREPSECRFCRQPTWIVFHGPRANHTVEPRQSHTSPTQEPQADSEKTRVLGDAA